MHTPQTDIILHHDGAELVRVTLPPGEYVIGSSREAQVCAETPLLAREHARLTINYDHVLIEVLDSRLGVFVAEKQITEVTRLFPNQSIRLGAVKLEIRRQRTPSEPGDSIAPAQAAIQRLVPIEILTERRYAIGAQIARGGMGAILDVQQAAMKRRVAMKVMLDTDNADRVARFVDEAQITGQLAHPNIVPVHELGMNEDGQLFYTMKFVRGMTLKEVLESLGARSGEAVKKFPLTVLLTVFQKVCDAIAFAHSKGVIHRDLKPENIMLGDFGEVLVMDWGLAKVIVAKKAERARPDETVATSMSAIISARSADPEVGNTLDGVILGSPQYMSPEQARGEVETLDARTDIYSVGAILYHILALRPSVKGRTSAEVISKVASGELDPLPVAAEGTPDTKAPKLPHLPGGRIPESLAAVCRKAIALEPAERYQRIEDLQADISAYQSGFATSAEDKTAWLHFTLFLKRHQAAALATAAALVLLVLVSTLFTMKVIGERTRAESARGEVVKEQRKLTEKQGELTAKTAEARKIVAEAVQADSATANDLAGRDRPRDALAYLARACETLPASTAAAEQAFIRYYSGNYRAPIALLQDATSPQFSPDGTCVLGLSGNDVRVWDATTGRTIATLSGHTGEVTSARFSPDGARIVTASSDKTARLWDAATDSSLVTLAGHEERVTSVQFSPDGGRVLTASEDKTAKVWEAMTGRLIATLTGHTKKITGAQFSPDAERIFTTSDDLTARLWNARTGSLITMLPGQNDGFEPGVFSQNGSCFITIDGSQNKLMVWNSTTGQLIAEVKSPQGLSIFRAEFSPDGKRIVTVSGQGRTDPWNAPLLSLGTPSALANAILRPTVAALWNAETGNPISSLSGFENGINAAHFSPDGLRIVTASDDKTTRVWDGATGILTATISGHKDRVWTAQFSPDGKRILTASDDQTVRLWDAASGRPISTFLGHGGSLKGAWFSPDGARIVSEPYGENGPLLLWDATVSELVAPISPEESSLKNARMSPDGKRVITSSGSSNAEVWDTASGSHLGTLAGHSGRLASAEFSPDGSRMLTASGDGEILLWDAATGHPLSSFSIPQTNQLLSAQFSPDGNRIVTTSYQDAAKVWNAATGQAIVPLSGDGSWAYNAGFSPGGMRVVTVLNDNTARLWDSTTGQLLTTFSKWMRSNRPCKFSPDGARILALSDEDTARVWDANTGQIVLTLSGHYGPLTCVQFSPDGTQIVTASKDKTARVWDAFSGRPLASLVGHKSLVSAAQFSLDGTRIVTASNDGTGRVWEAATGRPIAMLSGHRFRVTNAEFSADGKTVLTASSIDKTARLWDAATGKLTTTFSDHDRAVLAVGFDPDGGEMITASWDSTARVRDLTTGRTIATLSGHEAAVVSAEFSRDRKRVVTTSKDRTGKVWDAASGQCLATLSGHFTTLHDAEFSPDGGRIVTVAGDDIAGVWDAATGKLLATLDGDTAAIWSARFSPNGANIVTTSSDKTALLWDATTGALKATLSGHEAEIYGVEFSPDGKRIITASADKTARVWDASTGKNVATVSGHKQDVNNAQFSRDGSRLITESRDDTARLWDAATGESLTTIEDTRDNRGERSAVWGSQISPDNARVVAVTSGNARVWDAVTGKPIVNLPLTGRSVETLEVSPDDTRVLAGLSDGTVRVWEVLGTTQPVPAWFSQFLRVLATRRLNAGGELTDLAPTDWIAYRAEVTAVLKTDTSRYGDVARYYFTSGLDRPVRPGAKLTCREAADTLITPSASKADIERAYELDPVHPLVHLALARFEPDPVRATFLREYSLKRLIPVAPAAEQSALRQRAEVWMAATPQAIEAWRREEEAAAQRQQRMLAIRIAKVDLSDAVTQMKWEEAAGKLAVVDKMIPADQRAELNPVRFKILIGRNDFAAAYQLAKKVGYAHLSFDALEVSQPGAYEFAEKISDAHLDNADLQDALAQAITTQDTDEPRKSILAEKFAIRASEAARRKNPEYLDTLARVLFIQGNREEAIQLQNQAVTFATDEQKPGYQKTLDSYRKGELPQDMIFALRTAALQAWSGKDADHAATCRRMLELAAGTDDPSTAERAAKAYCLRPSSNPQLIESAVTLARRAVDLGKEHGYLHWYEMALGMAEYRHANYLAADQALSAAQEKGKNNRLVHGPARLFRAMSFFKRGKVAEARQLFIEAEAQMTPLPADESQPLASTVGHDDVIVWLAYREAKALLATEAPTVPPKSGKK